MSIYIIENWEGMSDTGLSLSGYFAIKNIIRKLLQARGGDEIMNEKRIVWLDGIKGLACLAVMWHHFILSFFPLLYSDSISTKAHSSILEKELQQSPWLFWVNGKYMVMLFLFITGIVVFKKVVEMNDANDLPRVMIKRYLRLMFPLAVMTVTVFLFMKCGWLKNNTASAFSGSSWLENCCPGEMNFLQMIYGIIAETWFGAFRITGALWMMSILFKGSYLVILLAILTWKVKPGKVVLIYFVLAGIMVLISPYYAPMCLGAAFYICYKNYRWLFNHKCLGIVGLVVGCFFGGYPSGVKPNNVYRILCFLPEYIDSVLFWHIAGAMLTIYSVANLLTVQKILSKKLMVFLGNISYAVYLWHPFFLSTIASYVYIILNKADMNEYVNVGVTFVVMNVAVIVFTYLFTKYIEQRVILRIIENVLEFFGV